VPLVLRAGRRVRAVLVAGAALALAAGCTTTITGHGSAAGRKSPGPTPLPAAPAQPRADFHDCRQAIRIGALGLPPGRAQKLSFGCAQISVPLDYSAPATGTISLQLVKIHDSDNHAHTGSLLVNPGGPGGSGVNFALGLTGELSDEILSHFDIVGFDPRGVGLSSPINCLTNSQKDAINAASPDVLTAAGFARAKAIAKEVASACSSRYGSSLADYDTVATARDMDQIRQAVGDPQLNYLGFSYGTELGAQYIHLFPDKVRVAVLDGAVDPLTGELAADTNQLRGFEGAFDQFAAWCTKHSPCSRLGDARKAVYRIVATAQRSPIPTSAPGDSRKATVNLVLTGVEQAMYSQSLWSSLGQALLEAQRGDSKGLLALADQYNERFNGQYTNISDANTTINCNDTKPGPSDPTIRATARSWSKRFPLFGLSFAPSLFLCQQWQPRRTVPPLPTAPGTPHKVLVIGNLHDPATPYQGAKDLTKTLGNAELLTWNGEGHTSYLQGSTCIDGYVNAYLVHGTLPPPHRTCAR
jgi:pimeloyl-ACP methyl ester carboxylesterase